VAARKEYIEKYKELFANPFKVAELGYIDAIITPSDTRKRLIEALELLANKRDENPPKKHGNIPL
jgi:propionyl-CoA carboxylase beta chain